MENPNRLKKEFRWVCKVAICGAVLFDAIILLLARDGDSGLLGILLVTPSAFLYSSLIDSGKMEPLSAALVINALLGAIVFGLLAAVWLSVKDPHEK